MEEIKVNDFVRLRDGEITRVKAINEKTFKCEFHKVNCELFIDYIVKHSSNIIDLIEVGDFVNGKKVEKINEYKDGKSIIALIGIIDEKDIKSILTKEQFANAEYRLEE